VVTIGVADLQTKGRLTFDQERRLISLAQQGGRPGKLARAILIRKFTNYVHIIVRAMGVEGCSLSFDLARASGLIGLNHAIDKFDLTRDNRFTSYATWWIKHSISRAMEKEGVSPIKVPIYIQEREQRCDRFRQLFLLRTGRWPTDEELMAQQELTKEEIDDLRLARLAQEAISLQLPIFIDDPAAGSLQERVRTNEALTLDYLLAKGELEIFSHWVESLPVISRRVVKLFYGFWADQRIFSLKDIGLMMGISYQRVQQKRDSSKKYLIEHAPDIMAGRLPSKFVPATDDNHILDDWLPALLVRGMSTGHSLEDCYNALPRLPRQVLALRFRGCTIKKVGQECQLAPNLVLLMEWSALKRLRSCVRKWESA